MKKYILLLILGIFLISFVLAEGTFTPIFCNDYEFTGCYEEIESTNNYLVTDEQPWVCPDYATKCEVTSTPNEEVWIGSQNCALTDTLWCVTWECDDGVQGLRIMSPGDNIYLKKCSRDLEDTLQIEIYVSKLKYSGSSCGAGGVPVSGADGCSFQPNGGKIYDLGMQNPQQVTSFVVPLTTPSPTCIMSWISGKRHICGYKEESCSIDSDCGGHTYGNKECSSKTLQEYGCSNYGQDISSNLEEVSGGLLNTEGDSEGYNDDANAPSSGEADFGKRCEIISSTPVQCCGDTDCGNEMFCDIETFTCQEKAKCKEDSDCGVSLQCDWTTNLLKTPKCENKKCIYSESNVGCCLDKNCEEGYFCNSEKECEEKTLNSQNSSFEESTSFGTKSSASKGGKIILIIVLILVLGSVGYFIYSKNKL